MSKDPRTNPDVEQRLKENAVTMNKMTELRAQLENLSMTKKVFVLHFLLFTPYVKRCLTDKK